MSGQHNAYRFPFLAYRLNQGRQYLISILLILLLSALCSCFFEYINPEVAAFILLSALSVIATLFTIFPVLLAALLSALIWDFVFLAPHFSFHIGNKEDQLLFSMYFLVALANAIITSMLRRMSKAAQDKEENTKTLALYNTLLNSVSHELRTPIATIIGATDHLLETGPITLSATNSQLLLWEISDAAQRLNRQVENLLNMSRLESGFIRPRKDWCDIHELVCHSLRLLKEPLQDHPVVIDIPEGLPLVKIDYGLMEQVLNNLIYNAVLYTPQGSSINIHAHCADNDLLIVVEDNGKGFAKEEITKVFEKFYRPEHSRAGGSGLGLSIVKGFVEAHDGSISLENVATGGARFTIKIPADKLSIKQTGKWVLQKY